MVFVKLFKGLDDKISIVETAANDWIKSNKVAVRDVEVALAHAPDSKTGSGDLVLVVTYEADAPIA